MTLAEWFPRLDEKSLAFQILLAQRAIEALAVIIVVQRLYPPVSGFNGKTACNALRRKQFVPIFFAIGKTVFQIKRRIGEDFSAVSTGEALGMEGLVHRLQTVLGSRMCSSKFQ